MKTKKTVLKLLVSIIGCFLLQFGIVQWSDTNQTYAIADTQSPTAPSDLDIIEEDIGEVWIIWSQSTDNVGVVGYDIYDGATYIGSSSDNEYYMTGLSEFVRYDFNVRARDAAGNISAPSQTFYYPEQFISIASASDFYFPLSSGKYTYFKLNPVQSGKYSIAMLAYADQALPANSIQLYRNSALTESEPMTVYMQQSVFQFYYANLEANRSYYFKVGPGSGTGTRRFVVSYIPSDTSPPTVPSNLTISSQTSSSVTLTWGASTDNVGISNYQVYQGSSLIGTTQSTSYTVNSLSANVSYVFTVKAEDTSSNLSAASNAVTFFRDTQVPTIPGNLAASNQTKTSLTLTWTASTDNAGVTEYEIYSNGIKIGTSPTTSYTYNGLVSGTVYQFTVKAKDAAGNLSAASGVLQIQTPLGKVQYVYDPAGKLDYIVSENGSTIDYQYDTNGNLIGIQSSP